jgi:hypothetical protein
MRRVQRPIPAAAHLECSIRGLNVLLQRGFTMGIRMAWFDMKNSLEDF